jgi:hypothetical protein
MTVVLPKQPRGPGALDSGWLDVSARLHPGVTYSLTALMDAADMQDATLVLTGLTLQLADSAAGANARTVWQTATWTCGTTDRNGNPAAPACAWSSGDTPKAFVRATITLPRSVPFGLDLSAT